MSGHIIIGVDPGTNTGYAEWDVVERKFVTVGTLSLHAALFVVRDAFDSGRLRMVVFEDARLRKWFGHADARMARSGAGIREGVGSVKRDSAVWAEFLADYGIPHLGLKPSAGTTKLDAETFAKRTGWTGRTSNHARDAACLVWERQ